MSSTMSSRVTPAKQATQVLQITEGKSIKVLSFREPEPTSEKQRPGSTRSTTIPENLLDSQRLLEENDAPD